MSDGGFETPKPPAPTEALKTPQAQRVELGNQPTLQESKAEQAALELEKGLVNGYPEEVMRDFVGEGDDGEVRENEQKKIIIISPKLLPPEEWGKIAREELQIHVKRFSNSHGPYISSLLESLNDFELGKRVLEKPVLSQIKMGAREFLKLVEEEGRVFFSYWLTESNDFATLINRAEEVELRLFTDGQEIVILWEGAEGQRKGWVVTRREYEIKNQS